MAARMNKPKTKWDLKRTYPLHLMLVPAVILTVIFCYIPMFGVVMAFQDFKPWLGFAESPWVGLDNFVRIFNQRDSMQIIWNTFLIAMLKIVAGLIAPFAFALFLNEVACNKFKRTVQTMVYLPYFLSWVILGGIMTDMLSVDGGIINRFLVSLCGIEPIFFLGDGNWFRFIIILTHVWKEFGYGAIIYLAALTSIDPTLYEAAIIDGANRWKQTLHVTIPSIMPITVVVATLALGGILNAGFDQIFNMYNPMVYAQADIIDTYVYRVTLIQGQMGFGTAVGLFKSLIGMIMIVLSYWMANKFANYRIF